MISRKIAVKLRGRKDDPWRLIRWGEKVKGGEKRKNFLLPNEFGYFLPDSHCLHLKPFKSFVFLKSFFPYPYSAKEWETAF